MLNQATLQTLRALKLTGMAQAFEHHQHQPEAHHLSFEERFGLMVDSERLYRDNRRLKRLLTAARFKQNASLEDIDYGHERGLQRAQIAALAPGEWVQHRQNLALTGPTGCGKTYLACALGHQACRLGFTVLYARAPRLFEELRLAHADGTFSRRLKQLARVNVLILDDWGLNTLTRAQCQDLMELIDDRHTTASTVITSQLPTRQWHEHLGDATLADAILDRLLHNAHKIHLSGESIRKKKATPSPS